MQSNLPRYAALLVAATSLILPVNANTSLYDSQGAAKRACERWAAEGETIFVSSATHIDNPTSYESDSEFPKGHKHAGKVVYLYMMPILLRSCNFDYETTAYVGYQHQGLYPAPEWWPKRVDGSDWEYNGKVLRVFRGWNHDSDDAIKVNSYPF